ncbi:hypothetical protein K2173_016671 [Erythroxylum novogranatense]|uniref:Interactor of constitutive active ROPs 3 n=1 Tax=Erythroxylum novogranatense TaxID=1862640 RepID=A0AAV8SHF3_9ROSI|nr:hypothetical protein K2173_016671 [Erythroxylum novogranatense]
MQTPKGRSGSSEVHQKAIARAVRQLKTTGLDATSSTNQSRTPRERSPKVTERRSPRSPVPEKKRPSKISELETRVSKLQEELKQLKDQLSSSELLKKQALEDAEEYKKQLVDIFSKLEESQKQLKELSSSEEVCVIEVQSISKEKDQTWQSELESVRQQHSVDLAALASAMSEIEWLKCQLETVVDSDVAQNKNSKSEDEEIQILKENLMDTLCLVDNMKKQLKYSKESEAQAQAFANETLLQLEVAKKCVEALRSDGLKSTQAYKMVASELDQSRTRVNVLEQLVSKLETDLREVSNNHSPALVRNYNADHDIHENERLAEANLLKAEVCSLKSEVEQLKSALEAAEIKGHQEQIHSTVQLRSAYELLEQIKSDSAEREAELESELKQAKADIEELKAELMDKETELQGITEENEALNMKLMKSRSYHKESELENDLKKLNENFCCLKASLVDKETELQNALEESRNLKLQPGRRELEWGKAREHAHVYVEAISTAEQEALAKLETAMEEADKSNKWAARVTEQLEAAQAANSELEAELRRLKVQCDQWRKAAEAAVAMLASGNNGKMMERTGSLDSNYSPTKFISPFSGDIDYDLLKKKNGNMLKKIGVLWKKPQNRT